MRENDCFNCDFIDEYMCFYNIIDFYEKSNYFKAHYQLMTKNEIHLYRWYVYANVNMDLKTKDLIWEYLNANEIFDEVNLKCRMRILYEREKKKNTIYNV